MDIAGRRPSRASSGLRTNSGTIIVGKRATPYADRVKSGLRIRSADIGPSDLLPPYGESVGFPGIAVCVEPESPEALVAGIRQALDMPIPNPVAREYARRFLDKEEILGRFEGELVRLVEAV